jgi:predicted RNA-binding protein with PUA-like domain
MNYWLMKTEPSTFGIDHLAKKPKKTAMWDGCAQLPGAQHAAR